MVDRFETAAQELASYQQSMLTASESRTPVAPEEALRLSNIVRGEILRTIQILGDLTKLKTQESNTAALRQIKTVVGGCIQRLLESHGFLIDLPRTETSDYNKIAAVVWKVVTAIHDAVRSHPLGEGTPSSVHPLIEELQKSAELLVPLDVPIPVIPSPKLKQPTVVPLSQAIGEEGGRGSANLQAKVGPDALLDSEEGRQWRGKTPLKKGAR